MIPQINQAREPRELLNDAISWLTQGKRIALVTLVAIEGNAPYPIGTQMLVDEQGNFKGQITGGCAEKAIAEQCVEAIQSGENLLQRYGLGSPFFDIQLPCGSGIDVFVDVTSALEQLTALNETTGQRQPAIQTLSIRADQTVYYKTYRPTQRLIVLGQGPIMTALSKMACQVGYDVVCVAQNTDTHEALKMAGLTSSLLQESAQFGSLCDEFTALVSLFHEHEYEIDILATALTTDLFYIGALGSQRTHQARIESLRSKGFGEPQLARVVGPVGANIGAVTPVQIAVSIVSELIEVGNQREHGG